MSASLLFTTTVLPGRERDAFGLLRETRGYLEQFGNARVSMYRTIYGGEQSGRVIVLMGFEDRATRGAAADAMVKDAANNPSMQALYGPDAPITSWKGATLSSLQPEEPPPTQVPVRWVFAFQPQPGRRDETEAALRDASARHGALGVRAQIFRADASGPTSSSYTYVLPFGSMSEQADFEERNRVTVASMGLPLMIQAIEGGAMSMLGLRIDGAYARAS